MSRYTTFYLWCPNWEPRAETNHPTLEEAIRDDRWNVRTPWCRFQGTHRQGTSPRTIESEYAWSSPERVQDYINGFHCLIHQTPPTIFRREDALLRRQHAATYEHYTIENYSGANAPPELLDREYYYRYGAYRLYTPKKVGRERTLHFEWENYE